MALFNLLYTLIIIYTFGLLYHLYILKTFKELDDSNRQKALLLKEVHHRVKNNLNVIASIIGLQENSLEGKAKEELTKSKSRIESIALVHEMLYRHEDFQNIDFKIYMQRLSTLLLSMYVEEHEIQVHIQSTIKTMPLNVMVQLGIMVNECVTNSIKYAFTSKKGDIHIRLEENEAMLLLTYMDNGLGHASPQRLLENPSLGIKLIHLTAKQLKGSLSISSPKGLKYEIRFQL
jgi:two-component sensor histidine kinase